MNIAVSELPSPATGHTNLMEIQSHQGSFKVIRCQSIQSMFPSTTLTREGFLFLIGGRVETPAVRKVTAY